MPKYRVRVDSTSWIDYEVEANDPTDAARKGWQGETDGSPEIGSEGQIENVWVWSASDRWLENSLDYDEEVAMDDTKKEEVNL